ncbi:DUF4360 domain-containing protein [Bdellovibrio svalbardensis]|uniref:DUF4360 domain-containing protein n=1 Tax=Bdellovibrio svalbardensis TaxID=2972972 RepID=A0ABT6DHC7_9BACT|nr:DUF4360 domain-containing protein [Bdellovibrio svalbardensis]MDG0815251.1 DUF4360 domain-containing protein [Bdellovibrio svalbardensis]
MHRSLFLLLAPLFFVSTSRAEVPAGISIQGLQANGTGCPQGSYSANISPDGQAFSLLLDNYVAASDLHNPISRLNCELRVNFRVPRGWTFTVVTADYRGYAYAEQGSTVFHQALYSFDGSKPINERPGYENNGKYSFRAQEFRGPYNGNYTIHQELNPSVAPWAPCSSVDQQTLFITTYLMARNLNLSSSIQAQITLDSVDGAIQSQNFQLRWRRCGPSAPPNTPPPREENPRPPVPNPGRPPRFPEPGRR